MIRKRMYFYMVLPVFLLAAQGQGKNTIKYKTAKSKRYKPGISKKIILLNGTQMKDIRCFMRNGK